MKWMGIRAAAAAAAAAGDRDGWDPLWKGYQDYYEVDLSETTDNT